MHVHVTDSGALNAEACCTAGHHYYMYHICPGNHNPIPEIPNPGYYHPLLWLSMSCSEHHATVYIEQKREFLTYCCNFDREFLAVQVSENKKKQREKASKELLLTVNETLSAHLLH